MNRSVAPVEANGVAPVSTPGNTYIYIYIYIYTYI